MTRYQPSRSYLWTGMIALLLGGFCGGYAVFSMAAIAPAALFLVTASCLLWLGLQPGIGIGADYLSIGRRRIAWTEITRVDRTSWVSPLIVRLEVAGKRRRVLLIYAGDLDSASRLLRHLRRSARNALIDGVPYLQFWGQAPTLPNNARKLSSPRYRLLRAEDEAEVERMLQQLRTVGHIDTPESSEENNP